MKTINKQKNNLGGLTKIYAVPNDVISVSGTTVTISDSTNVYEIYCSPDTMEFSELKEKTDAGIHYNTRVDGFTPGSGAETQEAMEYMEYRKWVVLFKDGNGNYKMAGTTLQPLRMNVDFATGKDTIGRVGYSFSFSGNTTSRSVFVDNPF